MPVPSSDATLRLVAPSKNVTLPVGTVLPEAGLTCAVNVILVPLTADVAVAASTVVVEITGAVTATLSTADVLPEKVELPP